MRIDVLGVGFDNITLQEAVDAGEVLLGNEGFSYVVTPNPEFLLRAKKDEPFRQVLNAASLVLPDGIGVIKAAKILGRPLRSRVPGVDFAAGLMERMAASGKRLFLLGSKPGIAETARDRLCKKYPGLTVCGTGDGYFSDSTPVVRAIRASRADVLFVCLGSPKQELWMARYGPETGVKLAVGLGGALDVFAGAVQRAPEGFQKLGLEWLYRLGKEPKRIGRMAKLPLVLVDAAAARLRGK